LNLLNIFSHLFGGFLAGYSSWLSSRGGVPWGFGENFLGTLFITGVFSSLFLGFNSAFLSLGNEMRYSKALRLFSTGVATGLAIPMLGAVLFSMVFDVGGLSQKFPTLVTRCFWWITLAGCISFARYVIMGSSKSGFVSFVSLVPGVLFSGILLDRFFLPRDGFFVGAIVFGVCSGASQGLGLELLKEAWIESASQGMFKPQFILETEEFIAGRGDFCDMTFPDGPEQLFAIVEKDSVHFLTVLDENPLCIVGKGRIRHKALVDGDAIKIGPEVWIYHNRYARTRDAIPQGAV